MSTTDYTISNLIRKGKTQSFIENNWKVGEVGASHKIANFAPERVNWFESNTFRWLLICVGLRKLEIC